jgi:hypothetical protein
MRRCATIVGAVATATTLCGSVGTGPASAASSATQGVTATTVSVGIPYVDVASLKSVGVNLNFGNVPDAYKAIINNVNAHGGINGRKVVPYVVAVSPIGTAPAATVCTQLTQDDHVFVVMRPLQPSCYQEHNTPVLNGLFTGSATQGAQPDFTLTPPPTAFDPLQLTVYNKLGRFKNKTVGLFAGSTQDEPELKIVQTALAKFHVNVVQTAVDAAPQGDIPAANAQVALITQKFQSSGVNEVVAVGTGVNIWLEALGAIQSTYNPPWLAISVSNPAGTLTDPEKPYIKNMTYAVAVPPGETVWKETQSCVSIIRKAYPTDTINAYRVGLPQSEVSYIGPENACTDVALFAAIAKAAGRHLTVASFDRAGYGLRNVVIPGAGGAVSFAPGRPYPVGAMYIGHYDASVGTVVYQTTSATKGV